MELLGALLAVLVFALLLKPSRTSYRDCVGRPVPPAKRELARKADWGHDFSPGPDTGGGVWCRACGLDRLAFAYAPEDKRRWCSGGDEGILVAEEPS